MVNAANVVILARTLAKLDLALANLQGSNLMFQCRGGNLKLRGSSGRPGDAASACGQRGLNNFSLRPRLPLPRRRRCNTARSSRERFIRKPHLIDRKDVP